MTACSNDSDVSYDEEYSAESEYAEEVEEENDYVQGTISDTNYQSSWLNLSLDFPADYTVDWDYMEASEKATKIQKENGSKYQVAELSLKDLNNDDKHFYIMVDFPKENKDIYQDAEDTKEEIVSAYENAEVESYGSITINSDWNDFTEYEVAGSTYIISEWSTETYVDSELYNTSTSWFLCTVNNGHTVSLQFTGFTSWSEVETILSSITTLE